MTRLSSLAWLHVGDVYVLGDVQAIGLIELLGLAFEGLAASYWYEK